MNNGTRWNAKNGHVRVHTDTDRQTYRCISKQDIYVRIQTPNDVHIYTYRRIPRTKKENGQCSTYTLKQATSLDTPHTPVHTQLLPQHTHTHSHIEREDVLKWAVKATSSISRKQSIYFRIPGRMTQTVMRFYLDQRIAAPRLSVNPGYDILSQQ